MKTLTAFFQKLRRYRHVMSIFLAGVLLIVSTACSSSTTTTQRANPNNPAVQAGGANNPYKSGGDKMAQSGREQANLPFNSLQLIAANQESEILYPGAETPSGRAAKESELPIKTNKDFTSPESGGLNQRNPDLGERAQTRIEKVQEAFTEASKFVKDKADEAGQRPEAQSNPALHK